YSIRLSAREHAADANGERHPLAELQLEVQEEGEQPAGAGRLDVLGDDLGGDLVLGKQAVLLLDGPERRIHQEAEVRGLLHPESGVLEQRDRLSTAVATKVHQLLVVDVV